MTTELERLRNKTRAMREEVEQMEAQLNAHLASLGITKQLNVDEVKIAQQIFCVQEEDTREYRHAATMAASQPKGERLAAYDVKGGKGAARPPALKKVSTTSPAPPQLEKKPQQKLSNMDAKVSKKETQLGGLTVQSLSISGIGKKGPKQ